MAWVRPSRSKPSRSRPGQGRFNCGDSGETCGWMPSPGGPGSVGAAGVRGRESHGAGGGRHGPLKQVPPVVHLCGADGVTVPIQPLPLHPNSPNRPRTSSRLGPGFRQIRLAFSHHLRRRLAGEVGVGEAAGQAVEAQQPLDWQQHLRLAADAAGVRWGPVPTVAKLNTAGALRQSPWIRPPTTGL
jgi:hypothetical protein